jgi:hypothetical protein
MFVSACTPESFMPTQCIEAATAHGTILSMCSVEKISGSPISMVDLFLCNATATAYRWIVVWWQSLFGHNQPLADLPRSSQSGTVGVCFHPIFRRAAFYDYLMLYGTGKYTTEGLMEQGFDCDSRCRVREQASELRRKTVSL